MKAAKGIRTITTSLKLSLFFDLIPYFALYGLITFFYAIFGMLLFRDVSPEGIIDETLNFKTFPASFAILFQVFLAQCT